MHSFIKKSRLTYVSVSCSALPDTPNDLTHRFAHWLVPNDFLWVGASHHATHILPLLNNNPPDHFWYYRGSRSSSRQNSYYPLVICVYITKIKRDRIWFQDGQYEYPPPGLCRPRRCRIRRRWPAPSAQPVYEWYFRSLWRPAQGLLALKGTATQLVCRMSNQGESPGPCYDTISIALWHFVLIIVSFASRVSSMPWAKDSNNGDT
jgi:hypothetical protein